MYRKIYLLAVIVCGSYFSFSQNITYTEILGRPTSTSITIKAVFDSTVEVRAVYGNISGTYPDHTSWQLVTMDSTGEAVAEINLTGLLPDTTYYYKLRYRKPGDTSSIVRPQYSFHTARPVTKPFIFTIQADPHLDASSDTALYRQCLNNQLDDFPDFMIDLGDNFMTDKLKNSSNVIPEDTIPYRCKLLRSYYQIVNHSVPLFLVLGNHESEAGWSHDGTADNITVWDTKYRKKYYSNPVPDSFYSGDTTNYAYVGQREAYYAFEWGDAQFIMLDPFWWTNPKPDSLHCWRWTLGKQQYDWLKATLESSTATFKFVFVHNLVGANREARGGTEWAGYYEWGGLNIDSTYGWTANRSGWYKPIKELLEENHVNIMFHGHDHFYGKQELNCMVYQECPQPSLPNMQYIPQAAEYGYVNGTFIPNSGHIRVSVSADSVKVDYVRAVLPAQETSTLHNKDVSATYTLGAVNCYDSLITENPDVLNLVEKISVYPNPFLSKVTIMVNQIEDNGQEVSVGIYDMNGRCIRTLEHKHFSGNNISAEWDGTSTTGSVISDGIYFCRVITGTHCYNEKILFCR